MQSLQRSSQRSGEHDQESALPHLRVCDIWGRNRLPMACAHPRSQHGKATLPNSGSKGAAQMLQAPLTWAQRQSAGRTPRRRRSFRPPAAARKGTLRRPAGHCVRYDAQATLWARRRRRGTGADASDAQLSAGRRAMFGLRARGRLHAAAASAAAGATDYGVPLAVMLAIICM
jgi:hypothetical protein